jgi:hypothetical protein
MLSTRYQVRDLRLWKQKENAMKQFAAAVKARRGQDNWTTKKLTLEAEGRKDAAKKAEKQAFSKFPSDKAWHSHKVEYCVEI